MDGPLQSGDVVLQQKNLTTRGRNKKLVHCYGGTPHVIIGKQGPTTVCLQNLETNKVIPNAVHNKAIRCFYGWNNTLPVPSPLTHPIGHHMVDIVDHRVDSDGNLEFRVKYSGYSTNSSKQLEWVKEEDISNNELLLYY